jgi:hypothetical protein
MKSSYLCNVKQTDGIYAPIREKMRTSKGVKRTDKGVKEARTREKSDDFTKKQQRLQQPRRMP